MLLLWLGLLAEIFILGLLRPLITNFELVSITVVFAHIVFSVCRLIVLKNPLRWVYLAGFIGRCLLLFWDIYGRNIFSLPNSGADSEMFYLYAVAVSENSSLLGVKISGGIYSKIIGALFTFIGPQRLFGQYVNVLLGLSVVFILNHTLRLIKLDPVTVKKIVLIAALFPNSMIMSAIFLREIFPTFFVACSLWLFVKWYEQGKSAHIWMSLVMLGLAGMFHSGVLSLFFGYVFMFIFYDTEKKTWLFSHKSLFTFLMISAAAIFAYSMLNQMLFSKFQNVEEWEDIYTVANRRAGDSRYLVGLTINSPVQIALFGPVKALYFLFSPLPTDWRGFMDIFTFVFDSLLYLTVLWKLAASRIKLRCQKPLVIAVTLMITVSAFVFGLGVSNTGTAVRHRQKILPAFLLLYAVQTEEKRMKVMAHTPIALEGVSDEHRGKEDFRIGKKEVNRPQHPVGGFERPLITGNKK